jgi:hypothetical protein
MNRLDGDDLLTRYRRELEGLTPGGSEFIDDPERCSAVVKATRSTLMHLLREKNQQIRVLEAELTKLKQLSGV